MQLSKNRIKWNGQVPPLETEQAAVLPRAPASGLPLGVFSINEGFTTCRLTLFRSSLCVHSFQHSSFWHVLTVAFAFKGGVAEAQPTSFCLSVHSRTLRNFQQNLLLANVQTSELNNRSSKMQCLSQHCRFTLG